VREGRTHLNLHAQLREDRSDKGGSGWKKGVAREGVLLRKPTNRNGQRNGSGRNKRVKNRMEGRRGRVGGRRWCSNEKKEPREASDGAPEWDLPRRSGNGGGGVNNRGGGYAA
jgi:hypothetical protein